MTNVKTIAGSCAVLLLLSTAASAVTVKNTSDAEVSIGIDRGNEENVQKIAPGESTQVECKELCGLTGPWGFSWMAKGDTTISTNGQSLISVDAKDSAATGASTGEAGEAAESSTERSGQ